MQKMNEMTISVMPSKTESARSIFFNDLCLCGNRAMKEGLAQELSYPDIRNRKVSYIKEEVKKIA